MKSTFYFVLLILAFIFSQFILNCVHSLIRICCKRVLSSYWLSTWIPMPASNTSLLTLAKNSLASKRLRQSPINQWYGKGFAYNQVNTRSTDWFSKHSSASQISKIISIKSNSRVLYRFLFIWDWFRWSHAWNGGMFIVMISSKLSSEGFLDHSINCFKS